MDPLIDLAKLDPHRMTGHLLNLAELQYCPWDTSSIVNLGTNGKRIDVCHRSRLARDNAKRRYVAKKREVPLLFVGA